MSETTILDCSGCVGDERPECSECIVRFLVDRDARGAAALDPEEERAVRALAASGLLADVRHLRAAG
ncbi:MAG TPA: hypothetical protein VM618_05415 [Acidimicrobiia bacterium]|nr:hypothetical protein [Acidimicrobiia bacterium]